MMRTKSAVSLLAAGSLMVMVHCSKESTATPPIQKVDIGSTTAAGPSLPTVKQFVVSPHTIRSGQVATVHIELANAGPNTPLTVAWFAPSGWTVTDQKEVATGTGLDLQAPVGLLDGSGTYRAELRSGLNHLGETTLTVTD